MGIEGDTKKLLRKKEPAGEDTDKLEEEEEDGFDYKRYYADCGFDPHKEVIKEKRIDDFFKATSGG